MRDKILKLLPFAASLGSGFCAAYAMPPYGLVAFLFPCLSLLYLLSARTETPLRRFALGWMFGFGYFVSGLHWIGNALLVEGNPWGWAWPLAVCGLPALLAFFPALGLAFLTRRALKEPASHFLLFIFLMGLSEWLRGTLFTGFPWNLYGYAWTSVLPIAQTAALGGIYFLTLLTLFWAALPGFLYVARPDPRLWPFVLLPIFAILSFALCYAYGVARLRNNPVRFDSNVAVRIVQPNIPQEEKWQPDKMFGNFLTQIRLSKPDPREREPSARTTLIVWPETALSYGLFEYPEIRDRIAETLRGYAGDAYLLTGTLRKTGPQTYTNSVSVIDKNGDFLAHYDKSHLVPFGEYIPLQEWIPLEPVARFSGFQPGPGPQTLSLEGIPPFSPLVCYEIIFPGRVTNRERTAPDWILNVTNDGWYGNSAGPYQHLAIAVFRAIEEGVPVIRAANTGISAVIDPYGGVRPAPLLEEKTLVAYLPHSTETPPLSVFVGQAVFFGILGLFGLLGCPHIFRKSS